MNQRINNSKRIQMLHELLLSYSGDSYDEQIKANTEIRAIINGAATQSSAVRQLVAVLHTGLHEGTWPWINIHTGR